MGQYKIISLSSIKADQVFDLSVIQSDLAIDLGAVPDHFDTIKTSILTDPDSISVYEKKIEDYGKINTSYPEKIRKLVSFIYSQIQLLTNDSEKADALEKLKSLMQESRCFPDHYSTLLTLARAVKREVAAQTEPQSATPKSELELSRIKAMDLAKEFLIRHLLEIPDRVLNRLFSSTKSRKRVGSIGSKT